MNSVEAKTKIDELVDKKEEIIKSTSSIISKYVISTVQKTDKNFNSYVTDLRNMLKGFNEEETREILLKVVVNLANNGNFSNRSSSANEEKKKSSRSSDFGSFLRN